MRPFRYSIIQLTKIFIVVLLLFSVSPAKAQFTINDVYGDLLECDTMTRSIYIVWWDKDYNFGTQVDVLLDSMISYRNICLDSMAMMDPPNPLDGYYYNVYIHAPGSSSGYFYPNNWGNGQGTDINGYPFLTFPIGILSDWLNNAHETFHIFQYNANAPGFAYSGDSQWYIEASANWFAAKQNINEDRAFVVAESLVRIPHVPLWLSYYNYPASYPSNWQRYVHQYALALLLYYFTDVAGVSEDIITSGMYSGTEEMPQEYMFNLIGASQYRQYFIDWAAHMTNDFDFISVAQAATNLNAWNNSADPLDDNEYIATYTNEGTGGWVSPDDDKITNAWSFNTVKLFNSNTKTYTFEINGNPTGSYGDDAYFQGKVVVQNSNTGASFHDLTMSNDLQGSLSLNLNPEDTTLFFIIGSMPEIFQDNNQFFQLFPYDIKISIDNTTGISEIEDSRSRLEIARFNLFGKKVEKDNVGFQIIQFDDGTTKKVYSNGKF